MQAAPELLALIGQRLHRLQGDQDTSLVDGCEQSHVRAHQSRAFLSDQRALKIATRLHPLIAIAHRLRSLLGRGSNGCVRHPEHV